MFSESERGLRGDNLFPVSRSGNLEPAVDEFQFDNDKVPMNFEEFLSLIRWSRKIIPCRFHEYFEYGINIISSKYSPDKIPTITIRYLTRIFDCKCITSMQPKSRYQKVI